MPDYEPEKKELASRDVVSRRMEQHIAAGHGARNRFGEHLWLDIRLLGRRHIEQNLREVQEICEHFLGIDPARELIPVRPAQHYSMGGIRTDFSGQSPHLAGLFAAGEAACWDMHGFNRLGGNSVAETVVAGMIVGETIADYCESQAGQLTVSSALIQQFARAQQQQLGALAGKRGSESPFALIREMQDTMTANVGIFREGDKLQQAVDQLQALLRRSDDIGLRSSDRGAAPELVAAYRLRRMLKLALCVSVGALRREESRGAHYRADFPQRNDRDWLNRSLARWDSGSDAPALDYEPMELARMELPPGWRGYGARDHIPHPDVGEQDPPPGAPLPFLEQLPPALRGPNQRLEVDE